MADLTSPGPQQAATSFTFNGTTVSFSQDQQNILNGDINKLNDAVSAYNAKNVELAGYTAQVNDANSKLHAPYGICAGKPGGNGPGSWNSCQAAAQAQFSQFFPLQQTAQAQLAALLDSIKNPLTGFLAVYNNDLNQIQNSIKLQIQSTQANQATANQNTQNQIALNANTPENAAASQQAAAILQQQQLAAQTQTTNTTNQYILFGFIAIVIVGGIILILKNH